MAQTKKANPAVISGDWLSFIIKRVDEHEHDAPGTYFTCDRFNNRESFEL
jgi:hypothetical protein